MEKCGQFVNEHLDLEQSRRFISQKLSSVSPAINKLSERFVVSVEESK